MSHSFARIARTTRSVAGATAFATLAFAAGAQAQNAVVITAPSAESVPVRTAGDRDEIAGTYKMSDGRWLELRSRSGIVRADLDGVPVTMLRAVDATTLASADNRMSMRFGRDRDANMLVTVSLAAPGAAPQVIASLPAARR